MFRLHNNRDISVTKWKQISNTIQNTFRTLIIDLFTYFVIMIFSPLKNKIKIEAMNFLNCKLTDPKCKHGVFS